VAVYNVFTIMFESNTEFEFFLDLLGIDNVY
jgi:hypothetical protein